MVPAQRTVQRLGRPTAQKRRRQQDVRAQTDVAIVQLTTASCRTSERERNRPGARRFGRDRRPPEGRERAPSANIGRPGAVPARPRAEPVLPSALRFNLTPLRSSEISRFFPRFDCPRTGDIDIWSAARTFFTHHLSRFSVSFLLFSFLLFKSKALEFFSEVERSKR